MSKFFNKRSGIFAVVFVFLLAPLVATTVLATNNLELTATGTRFEAGEEITLDNAVQNDFFGAAERVIVDSDVQDNAFIAAGEILINGDVLGDVYAAAAYVVINGSIGGDIRVVADTVYISSNSVAGDIQISANKVVISEDTTTQGELQINASSVEDSASSSDVETDLSESTYQEVAMQSDSGFNFVEWFLTVVSSIASFTLVGYFILRLFPTYTEKHLELLSSQPLQVFGIGALTVFAGFFLGGMLLFSFIGLPLLLLLILLFFVALYFGSIYVQYWVGRMILKRFNKQNTGRLLPLLLGITVVVFTLFIVGLIEVLGTILFIAFVFMAIGLPVLQKYKGLSHPRK